MIRARFRIEKSRVRYLVLYALAKIRRPVVGGGGLFRSVRPTSPPNRDATPNADVFKEVHRLPPRWSGGIGVARPAHTRPGQTERFRTMAATVREVAHVTGGGHQYRVSDAVTGLTATSVWRARRRLVGPDKPHAELLAQVNGPSGVQHVPVVKAYVHCANTAGPVVRHVVLDRFDDPPANAGRVNGMTGTVGAVIDAGFGYATIVRRTVYCNAMMMRRSPDGRQADFLSQ